MPRLEPIGVRAARALRDGGLLLARHGAARARRCCRSTSPPRGSTTTCGRSGWRRTRCAWPPRTATRCARCAASTSTRASRDEYYLDLGAQAFARRAGALGVEHTLELFDAKHGGLTFRYPGAIRELVTALGAVRRRSTSPRLTCPMTWVRTKLELERLAPGEVLSVALPGGRGAGERAALGGRGGPRRRGRGHDGADRAPVNSRRSFFRDLRGRARATSPRPPPPAEPLPRRRSRTPSSTATRASSCCPSGASAAQLALRDARVLVVGAGALGSPVATYLAGAGTGRLGIVDADAVALSNLHRQHLHFTPDLGVPRRQRRGQARLPQPGRRSSSPTRCASTPPTPPGWSRARTWSSTAATPSPPATRSTPPAARPACRWSRAACWAPAGW